MITETVKTMKLAADKGLDFVSWDLMLNEVKMAEQVTLKLPFKGDNFV